MTAEKRVRSSQRAGSTLLRLLSHVWARRTGPAGWTLVGAFLCTFGMIDLGLAVPLVLRKIISMLSATIPETFLGMSAPLLMVLYGIAWMSARLLSDLREILMVWLTERSVCMLSIELFEHLQQLSLRFHLNRKTGALTNALERIHKAIPDILWGLTVMIPAIAETVLAMGILWYLYGPLYGGSLFLVLLVTIIFNLIGNNLTAPAQRAAVEKGARSEAFFVDSLINFETIRYFGNYEHEKRNCTSVFNDRAQASTRAYCYRALVGIGQNIILGTGLTVFVWQAGNAVLTGQMNAGDFVAINAYILQFVSPVQYFSYFMRKMSKGLNDMEGLFKLLDVRAEVTDLPDAPELPATGSACIQFENVAFGYDPRRPILRDVSFEVPEGKMIAIVGSTGAGKSTISRLLLRFYDVTGGRILINGQDIRTVRQDSVRNQIGIVPQDTVLFNNTLYYNVAYGRLDATREEVIKAIRLAHLDHFVSLLPEGYNTMVGERGLKLSGGEKQRIAIARVILKQPKIYIFDEATSALDTTTEREIQKNLEEVSAGSTTLMIAHRLSTVIHADEIIVLDHGRVAQRGTHQQLVQDADGIYARLWAKQIVCS